MCNDCCFKKLAELSKKHQLKNMLQNNTIEVFDQKIDKNKIMDFINNQDCCKNCLKNI